MHTTVQSRETWPTPKRDDRLGETCTRYVPRVEGPRSRGQTRCPPGRRWRGRWERRRADLLTAGAALLLGLVFNDHHALGRQSKYLAALHLQALHLAQVSLTVLAALHQVANHLIGRWREHQSASRVIGLPSGRLAASLALALGL